MEITFNKSLLDMFYVLGATFIMLNIIASLYFLIKVIKEIA